MILEHMYMPLSARKAKDYEWNQHLACFEERCEDKDHWDEEEELRQRYKVIEHMRAGLITTLTRIRTRIPIRMKMKMKKMMTKDGKMRLTKQMRMMDGKMRKVLPTRTAL